MRAFVNLLLQFTAFALLKKQVTSLIWRYRDISSHELLSYKNTVHLECVEYIAVNMILTSDSCQLNLLENTSLVEVECSGPGIHQISAAEGHSQNNITSLYIPLRREPYCYTWRTQTETSYTNTTRQLIVSVWIEGTGGSSSVQREEVTNQFYLLGESPWLTSLSPSVELNITSHSFKTQRKEWEFTLSSVETLPTEVLVEVVDTGVQVLGCGVSLHRFSIVTRLFNNSMLSTASITQNISSNTDLRLIQDSSTLAISILLTDDTGYMSSDDLTTLEQFEIIGVVGEITDAAFTDASLCLLISGGLHCLPYDSSHLLSPEVSSLPGIINHLTGRTIHTTEGIYNVLIIWSKTADMILVSENGGSSFTELDLPISPEAVHSVNIHPFKRIVSILVTSSSSLAQMVECDLGNMNCSDIGVSFTYSGGNLSAVYGADNFGDQFIWGTTQLYYSPTSGSPVTNLPVKVRNEETGLWSPVQWEDDGEFIKQTASGRGGQFAVLSSKNRLFYSTISYSSAIEIASGTLPNSPAVISFNSLGQLRIITLENGGIKVYTVPIYSLIMDALYPPPACPITHWTHTTVQSVFYLDKRESLTLWASLIPIPWNGNEISIALSDPGSIEMASDSYEQLTAVAGVVQRNKTVTLRPSSSLSTTTRSAVKIAAAAQNLACQTAAEMVCMVAMECPPGRHIRVRDSPRHCSSYTNYSYTIPKIYYDSTFSGGRSSTDKRVEYNVELYGCPIVVPYTKTFRPTLDMYDEDVFLEEVDADFVVWEIHGRHDYVYTANAQQAKCLKTPQTWDEMLTNETSPAEAWTPTNYRSCYEDSGELSGRTKYEILNSSGVSSLKWPERNGMYVFVATVIARDYSFCHLRTHFAVRVYGASGAAILGYILLVMTCLIGIGVLIFSYYVYRQKK